MNTKQLRDGEPCSHPGCLSHISHPCEDCGRIGGRTVTKLTPEQAVKTIDLKQAKEMTLIVVGNDGKVDTVGTSFLKQFFKHIESLAKYAEIGKAFVAHQKEVPCDFGYNDEDCQCSDCCDTIRRLCELSAEVE